MKRKPHSRKHALFPGRPVLAKLSQAKPNANKGPSVTLPILDKDPWLRNH